MFKYEEVLKDFPDAITALKKALGDKKILIVNDGEYIPRARLNEEIQTKKDLEEKLKEDHGKAIEEFKKAHVVATAASKSGAGEAEKAALGPYKDLMIRVAGYSAYFVTLSPEMRQEIIDRANFALETGKEQHAVVSL